MENEKSLFEVSDVVGLSKPLTKLVEVFKENGLVQLDQILELTPDDLKTELTLKLGARKRIMKSIIFKTCKSNSNP